MHGENDNRNNNGIDIGKTAVAIEYVPGEDDKLADTLSRLKIGDMIPTELYEVVAEILVFVNDLDNLKAKIDQR